MACHNEMNKVTCTDQMQDVEFESYILLCVCVCVCVSVCEYLRAYVCVAF